MVVIRVVYPANDDWKLMRIYDIGTGQGLAVGNTCSKIMAADWEASVAGMGGVEQDYINALGVTEVQDMR
jgi:hypothetical protein